MPVDFYGLHMVCVNNKDSDQIAWMDRPKLFVPVFSTSFSVTYLTVDPMMCL